MAEWSHDELRGWLAPTPGKKRMRLGLEHIKDILSRLSNPESSFPSIHVAGTNGKGSLCAHLSARGAANGVLMGMFSSPHLVRVEERVRIDGRPISSEEFDLSLSEIRLASEKEPEIEVTYFEKTMLVAMLAFRRAKIGRAIIETGLGGRLDATRCVQADLCAITTISEDHMEVLGPTLIHILREKAGIHREGVPLVMLNTEHSDLVDEARRIIGGDLIIHNPGNRDSPWVISRSMAVAIGDMLGWEVDHEDPLWPGRDSSTYRFGNNEIFLSAAHNYESILSEMTRLKKPTTLIIGLTKKQDLHRVLAPVKAAIERKMIEHVLILEPKHGRLPPENQHNIVNALGTGAAVSLPIDMKEAIKLASSVSRDKGTGIMVMGSIHLVGDCIEILHTGRGELDPILQIHPSHHASKRR